MNFSKTSPLFIKIPFCAATPAPDIIAAGVANPSEQGQAITITAQLFNKLVVKSFVTT